MSGREATNGGHGIGREKANNIFQCPVCLLLPICDIYQCKDGHLVCMICYNKLPVQLPIRCPTCRTAMPTEPIRARAVEQVSDLAIMNQS